jgi:acyl-CoA thioesterase I
MAIHMTRLALFAAAICMAFKMDAPVPKIMALGDSITDGFVQSRCYRYYLDSMLNAHGIAHDFVGSLSGPGSGWDSNHEGHAGWSAGNILAQINGWARSFKPGIVLMHLGTNDILLHESTAQTISDLGAIIDTLRAANPTVTVLIAQIIPDDNSSDRVSIDALNQQIPVLAALKSTDQSRIIVVDQNTGFNYATDLIDAYHPNESGARKIAAHWFLALQRNGPPSTGVTAPSLNKADGTAHIVKTEYYAFNGRRLPVRNRKAAAPAHALIIRRGSDAALVPEKQKQ